MSSAPAWQLIHRARVQGAALSLDSKGKVLLDLLDDFPPDLLDDLRSRRDDIAATGTASHPLLDVAGAALKARTESGLHVVRQAISGSEPEESDATEKAREALDNPPMSGQTYAWMTNSLGGVWACRLLYGESGVEVLIDILRQVPASDRKILRQRERTARALWMKVRFIPPKPRKRELYPADMPFVEKIVELAMASPRIYKHRKGVC